MEHLFVYGTLGPGRPNEHVLKDIGGTWKTASVTGVLLNEGWGAEMGYPGLVLDKSGETIKGFLFSSEKLSEHWAALDEFEGLAYQRIFTEVKLSDESQVEPLLSKVDQKINSFYADGAYDSDQVYEVILNAAEKEVVIAIPPRKDAALSTFYNSSPTARDHNILFVEKHGKYRWQDYSDYGYRSLVETAMFRYKTIIGETMYSRDPSTQKVESRMACLVLNKMAKTGMPESVRFKKAA